ncbi:TetR/AcrR family transcriptional regulator [Agaribacterium sp. ZY112]|uniref:TetR/AcrR family transcriptional regulator n=1 Tax=Agaribacterium sp. ZY112 TaxID=3233574 RepID=UPI003524AF79
MAGGRKLEFDKQQALEAAMNVFWQKGYGAASLSDLTSSMGINKPSLYSAFGNKEALFLQATDFYVERIADKHAACLKLANTDLRTRLSLFLRSIMKSQFDASTPAGCYVALCAAETEAEDLPEAAKNKVLEVAELSQRVLCELFLTDSEAQTHGLDKSAEASSHFLMALMHGTASLARTGKKEQELEQSIEFALRGIGL